MKQKEVAIVFIENSQWEFLIQDRKSISKAGEKWWFFGGWIDAFESPIDAIKRELKEELDLNVESKELLFLWMSHWCRVEYLDWSIWKVRNHSFRMKQDLDLNNLEVLEWDWAKYVSLKFLKKIMNFSMDQEAIMFYEEKIAR